MNIEHMSSILRLFFVVAVLFSNGTSGSSSNHLSTILEIHSLPVSVTQHLSPSPMGPVRVSLSSSGARTGYYALSVYLEKCLTDLGTPSLWQIKSSIYSPKYLQNLMKCTENFVVSSVRPHITFPKAIVKDQLDRLFQSHGKTLNLHLDMQIRQLNSQDHNHNNGHGVHGSCSSDRGTAGLKNLGNTCYMNSILQTLYASSIVRTQMQQAHFQKGSVGEALQSLFSSMGSGVSNPLLLAQRLGMNVMIQEDAEECFHKIFDEIQASSTGPDPHMLDAAYSGGLCHIIASEKHRFEKQNKERFVDVSLDVNQPISSVTEAMDRFTSSETIQGFDTKAHGSISVSKHTLFASLPEVLLLHLKRFSFDASTGIIQKLNHRIDIPLELNMQPYVKHKSLASESMMYDLQSVIIHTGNAEAGHYYTYVRPQPQESPDVWFKYDDTIVEQVSWEQVKQDAQGGQDCDNNNDNDRKKRRGGWLSSFSRQPPCSTTAYLLQYSRRSLEKHSQ